MTDLPFMPMYWERFFADTEKMAPDTQGLYALLLGKMWVNHGWLPADDSFVARLLRIDVRTWRSRHKAAILAVISVEIDAVLGPIYRQKRLVAELSKATNLINKNRERTARAREEKAAKSSKRRSVTEQRARSATDTVTAPVADADRAGAIPEPQEPPSQGDGGSGSAHTVAARSPNGLAATAMSGPFVPSAPKPPPVPTSKPAFLSAYEAAGGVVANMPKREGAPVMPHRPRDPGEPNVWDVTNATFKPKQPPPGTIIEGRTTHAEAPRHRPADVARPQPQASAARPAAGEAEGVRAPAGPDSAADDQAAPRPPLAAAPATPDPAVKEDDHGRANGIDDAELDDFIRF